MKKLFFYAAAAVAMASCSSNDYLGNAPDQIQQNTETGEIQFSMSLPNMTREGELIGETAAKKLGGMFVVEGTKGTEATDAPSSTVVFDNYLVGYVANTAATTASNTHNWEYVGKQTGITGRMTGDTWTALHGTGKAQSQTIKYWDYSEPQYDFIAWSTGNCEAVADAAADGKVKVTRINTGNTLKTDGFKMTALSANDLLQCYYTDIITAKKVNGTGTDYGKPVTLTFKNMAAKVRVALYETVPGYSVKGVKFYTSDDNPTAPTDLGSSQNEAALFTMGTGNNIPQSGTVSVYYPHIGTAHRDLSPQTADYNKARVTVTSGSTVDTKQLFGEIPAGQLQGKDGNEKAENVYLGRNITQASFAGDASKAFYKAVIPNTNGKTLTLRVDYTLVAIDGSGEEIKVYGAKAVVPSTYTEWQPNYAYTYIFKISDNSNGWTSQTSSDPNGLFPITFDAVVASFTDANAEQTTVTTVATPSITTYQQGHDYHAQDEYSNATGKDIYIQVMDNSGDTPTPKTDLKTAGKSLLFAVSESNASEAEVMDALQNRTNIYSAEPPTGRNGIILTKNDNISNTVTTIDNGVDNQQITVTEGTTAKLTVSALSAGTYAYVYCTTVPSSDKKVYHVVTPTSTNFTHYYKVTLTGTETPLPSGSTAEDGKVYFVKNLKADDTFDSYTFKQTEFGDDVTGLVEATISSKATGDWSAPTPLDFYFDVYYKNNGEYAVKVIKITN